MDFDSWYADRWGERWPSLRAALGEKTRFGAFLGPHGGAPPSGSTPVEGLPGCFAADEPLPQPPERADGAIEWYLLDAASVAAALALGVEPGESVLDLCAAPGGKSCVLGTALQGRGRLVANDTSGPRRERLKRVLQGCLPPTIDWRSTTT